MNKFLKRPLIAVALGFSGIIALTGAVTPNSAVTPQTPQAYAAQIVNASGVALVSFATGGANGTKVLSLSCSNTDTNAYNLNIFRVHSSTDYLLATISIPASAGNSTSVAPIQVISSTNLPGPLDSNNDRYLFIGSGDTISIASTTTVTAGKTISCVGFGADY